MASTVDYIQWNGHNFYALASGCFLQFQPDFDRSTEHLTVTLTGAWDDIGRSMPLEQLSTDLVQLVKNLVCQAWESWEVTNGKKLLRQPADRLYTRDGFELAEQEETPDQIRNRIGDEINRRRFKP